MTERHMECCIVVPLERIRILYGTYGNKSKRKIGKHGGRESGYGFQHMKNLVVRMLKDLFIQLMMRK